MGKQGGGVTAIYMYFPYHVLLPQILPALQRITPVFRLIKRTRNLGFWQAVPDRATNRLSVGQVLITFYSNIYPLINV